MKFITNIFIAALCLLGFTCIGCEDASSKREKAKEEISKCIVDGDFAEAHVKLDTYSSLFSESTREDLKNKLFDAEILNIISSGDDNATVILTSLITEYPITGTAPTPGLNNRIGIYDEQREYCEDTKKFNSLLDKYLKLAIAQQKYDLANVIITFYREDCAIHNGGKDVKFNGVKVDGGHSYVIYTWDSKNAAEKMLKEAMQK